MPMQPRSWPVVFADEFEEDFAQFDERAQDALLVAARALSLAGPFAGRPHVDSLKGSRHANMKELRYKAAHGSEVWRAAFAFDPGQRAAILVAAAKQGMKESLFYRRLLEKADRRYEAYLRSIDKE